MLVCMLLVLLIWLLLLLVVHRNAGQVAEFVEEHHPFHIPQSGLLLMVEVFNKGKLTNDFIGRAELDIDRLIQTPEPTWSVQGHVLVRIFLLSHIDMMSIGIV